MQKVSVMGWADQKKILKTVRKIGKKAELWPYPYNPQYQYHGFTSSQYNNYQNINYNYNYKNPSSSSSFNSYTAISMKPSSSSYNYYVHGYNNGDHFGYYQKTVGSTIINDKAISIFSDDNPHACSIM
ncbi:heavy metal-associated isoprenylated plant protein 28-like [Senna tora]|uniref:Heavy metal-associated isoprenylated plant protein 28-like n=1 Tax=Senna tora TaxID=362788 RepID=A0A834SH81_9FABA|nr:heavy metal-associated isoprenylated plant protein 28-like [Senna tora]